MARPPGSFAVRTFSHLALRTKPGIKRVIRGALTTACSGVGRGEREPLRRPSNAQCTADRCPGGATCHGPERCRPAPGALPALRVGPDPMPQDWTLLRLGPGPSERGRENCWGGTVATRCDRPKRARTEDPPATTCRCTVVSRWAGCRPRPSWTASVGLRGAHGDAERERLTIRPRRPPRRTAECRPGVRFRLVPGTASAPLPRGAGRTVARSLRVVNHVLRQVDLPP